MIGRPVRRLAGQLADWHIRTIGRNIYIVLLLSIHYYF